MKKVKINLFFIFVAFAVIMMFLASQIGYQAGYASGYECGSNFEGSSFKTLVMCDDTLDYCMIHYSNAITY